MVPQDQFPSWTDLDEFEREWYSANLRAARQQPLSSPSDGQAVRLTWLRTFHNPIVVRVDCSERCTVHAIRLSGKGGYEPGRIAETNEYVLSPKDATDFRNLLAESHEYDAGPDHDDILMLDGARWIVEMTDGADYQAWETYGPGIVSDEAFLGLLGLLVDLSRFDIPSDHYY